MLLGIVYTILNRLQLYIYTIPVAGTVPPVMLCLDALGRRWVGDCNYVLKAVNAWCFWNVLGALATHEPSLQNSAVHAPLQCKKVSNGHFWNFLKFKNMESRERGSSDDEYEARRLQFRRGPRRPPLRRRTSFFSFHNIKALPLLLFCAYWCPLKSVCCAC